MPTYQYACTACGHQLEAVQSFTDQPLTECPACEGRLRKLFNSVGIVFKGSGFYRTDSRSAADKSAADKSAADKSSADSSSTSEKSSSSTSSPEKSSTPPSSTSSSSSTPAKPAAATTS